MHRHVHHHLKRHSKRKAPAWLEKVIIVLAVAGPLATLPQIFKIWSTQNADGLSVITWSLYTLSALIWLTYSLVIKNRPLIINCFLWTLLQGTVMLGAIIY